MRQAIEPVTGANLAALGADEISDQAKFWSKRAENENATIGERERAGIILGHVRAEKAWRDRISAVKCRFLTEEGNCRHEVVTSRIGDDHPCPRLSEGACTKRKFELSARLLQQPG